MPIRLESSPLSVAGYDARGSSLSINVVDSEYNTIALKVSIRIEGHGNDSQQIVLT